MKLGLPLLIIGMILLLFGAGSTALPQLATVSFGGENGVSITGIPDVSASFLFVGIVIALLGLYQYNREKKKH